MRRIVATTAMVLVAGLSAGACGDDDGGAVRTIESGDSASGSGSGTGVGATSGECVVVGGSESEPTAELEMAMGEWFVMVPAGSTESGVVEIVVENQGEEPHELVIVSGVAAAALPLDEVGALDEEGLPEGAFIGEIEPFLGGEVCAGTFDLEPGDYTLLCNIVEEEADGTIEAHLAEGMVTEVSLG